jgi:hypothetical protein
VADQPRDFTSGTFAMYFDGSQAGLPSTAAGNLDAIEVLDNGNLLITTAGEVVVTSEGGSTLSVRREDILEFVPTSVGVQTAGTWRMYLDGSDVGLSVSTESIDGVAIGQEGQLFLSTAGSFSVDAVSGDNEDVFEFIPQQLGGTSAGSFVSPLLFNGNQFGTNMAFANVDAVEVADLPDALANMPPTAESQTVATPEDHDILVQLVADDGNADDAQSLTFEIIDGPAYGSIISFDAANGRVLYVPPDDFNGADSFTFVATDDTSLGGEALTSEPAVVTFEIAAVNDAPIISGLVTELVADEDRPILIQGLSISDVDAHEGNGLAEIALSVLFGTLHLPSENAADVAFEGNHGRNVRITGVMNAINAILAQGITYQGDVNFSGTDSFHAAANDLGNTGAGNAITVSGEVGITVRSAARQTQALGGLVDTLVASGELTNGEAKSLQAKLKTNGNKNGQIGRLGSFINQVQGMLNAGKLTEEEAAALIAAANTIRESLLID